MIKDGRWGDDMGRGIIRQPKLPIAGDDFNEGDAVWLDGDTVFPMYNETHELYGFTATSGIKGKKVLVAT